MSPAGSEFQLSCSVFEGYYISWALQILGRSSVEISNATVGSLGEALKDRGITVQNLGTQMSEIIFSGQLHDRESMVACVAVDVDDAFSRFRTEPVTTIIYGK